MTPDDADGTRLGPGREFRLIESILADREGGERVRVGPGDDAAVLDDGSIHSIDLAVEGVHFRFDWMTPEEAGFSTVAGALSDLAAMAAEPVGFLVSLGIPQKGGGEGKGEDDGPGDLARSIMGGVRKAEKAFGAPLLGGDLTRSPGPVIIDVAVIGTVGSRAPLLRSGAKTGDGLWVTGTLGEAATAIDCLRRGETPAPALLRRYRSPKPRIAEAIHLAETLGATAGLDLSDGLAGDAGHLAAASGVGIELEGHTLPLSRDAVEALGRERAVELALSGGDDYELLVALPDPISTEEVENFGKRFDLTLTRVGRVVEGSGVRIRTAPGAPARPLARGGWDHFGTEETRTES